ncbi:MAG: serine hydrolase, partial [Actinobacteria bacterium]|nr:serine hydrolase [Actinomycetota bacterium]
LEAALRPRVRIAEGLDYGYQWYLGAFPAAAARAARPLPWAGGMGNGGQRLFVVPDLDLVVAITAGNYDTADQSTTPSTIMQDVLLAGIER